MSDNMTRTDMGYAAWKENASTVAEARKLATANIAIERLNKTLVESWVVPVAKFLSDVGERTTKR